MTHAARRSVTTNPTTRLADPHSDQVVPLFGGTEIDCSTAVSEYISGSDWRIKANANTGYSNAGMINNVAGKVIANFWLDEVYSPEEGQSHRKADLHIHDLDCLTGYCAGWSLRALSMKDLTGSMAAYHHAPAAFS